MSNQSKDKAEKDEKTGRQPFISLIVGINDTGKSTFLLKKIKVAKPKRVLVVTQTGNPTIWQKYPEINLNDKKAVASFKGIRTVKALRYNKETLKLIYENFRNGMVIFDDCKQYVKSNLEHTKGLIELLGDFRHLGIDIWFVLHSCLQVPPEVWSHTKYAFIGKTNRMIPNSFPLDKTEDLIKIQSIVNQEYDVRERKGDNSKYGLFKLVKL
jgi:hypothetical protein